MLRYFISWLCWILKRKPVIIYPGFNCGLCGKWVKKEFSIPTYKSINAWWDTWDMCDECGKGEKKLLRK